MQSPHREPLGEQPSGELTPAVPTTRAGHAEVPADEDVAKVRLGSRQYPQPFQPGASSHRSTGLQGTTLCRPGGVADRCMLGRALKDQNAPSGERFALD